MYRDLSRLLVNILVTEFDRDIGLEYLRGMHLNDSKGELGSHKDRHQNLGMSVVIEHFRRTSQLIFFQGSPRSPYVRPHIQRHAHA